MSKADMHVEVKLMQTGPYKELRAVFNQPLLPVHLTKGF